ncbi:unnamed protein product [Toxocara canis]|uniref:Secreted protein n=1 Tax=Toxocara canis TaxID=6265 RepID=A0A183UGM0_TOXCA|nr:unnamed protein product [Toxocara canis]
MLLWDASCALAVRRRGSQMRAVHSSASSFATSLWVAFDVTACFLVLVERACEQCLNAFATRSTDELTSFINCKWFIYWPTTTVD